MARASGSRMEVICMSLRGFCRERVWILRTHNQSVWCDSTCRLRRAARSVRTATVRCPSSKAVESRPTE